jgi:hypothetical protein
MAEASGGDFGDGFLKGSITGAISAGVAPMISTALPSDLSPAMSTALTKAGTGAGVNNRYTNPTDPTLGYYSSQIIYSGQTTARKGGSLGQAAQGWNDAPGFVGGNAVGGAAGNAINGMAGVRFINQGVVYGNTFPSN